MIIGAIPIIVAFLAAFILKEYPSKLQSLFIFLSFAGITVIVTGGESMGGTHFFGYILLLGAAFSAAFYNILSRRHSMEFTSVEITLVMMVIGALGFNAASLIKDPAQWWTAYRLLGQAAIGVPMVYLGILSSIVAFFLLNYMLSRVEAARAASFINLTTLVAVLAGVWINGDPLKAHQAIGSFLIVLGVWGANRFRYRTHRNSKEVHK